MASSNDKSQSFSESADEQRERRLQRRRERDRARRAAETAEQREERLARRRVRDRARRAAQTVEQRQACQERRRYRLNVESVESREARLQQMRINQRERLAAESVEEREDRRQRASERETCANREEPFKQRSVQMKMRRFHDYFATLNSPKCSTCYVQNLSLVFSFVPQPLSVCDAIETSIRQSYTPLLIAWTQAHYLPSYRSVNSLFLAIIMVHSI